MKKIFFIITFILCFVACDDKEKKQEVTEQASIGVDYYRPFNLYFSDGQSLAMKKTQNGFEIKTDKKAVLFSFFINDCAPCDAQNVFFNKLKDKYKDLQIIAIPLEELDEKSAVAFKENKKVEFHLAYGENNFFLAKAISDEIRGLPFSVLLNDKGEILQSYDGLMPPEMLEFDIKKVM